MANGKPFKAVLQPMILGNSMKAHASYFYPMAQLLIGAQYQHVLAAKDYQAAAAADDA